VRVVFDTVILVRGLINPFSPCGRLVFDHANAYRLVVSPPMVAEYHEVIFRPQLVHKYRTVAGRDHQAMLNLIARADVVQPEDMPPVSRDPTDDKFLAAAKFGLARFIVSEDADLLDIGHYDGITIISALAFLRYLESEP
jgi:putative PIN family toxin of toxin-antitoxin system